ncbi:MAG: zinc ribbon domain-containing protein [Dehalococcoidales bacterium]|nr:zinc ribbon domain-containing protein [Dehalococcoidales bacterium]
MPIYEYGCTKCGEKFELLRRFTDKDGDIKCPKCGKPAAKRTLSTFATASSSGGCAPGSHSGSG